MGKKLESLFATAHQHMGKGILQDIGLTRLKYIIGNELLKKASELDDNPDLLNLIEEGILSLSKEQIEEIASANLPERAVATHDTESKKSEEKSSGQNRFVLKLKKDNTNGQVKLFTAGMLFEPVSMENELFHLLKTSGTALTGEIFDLARKSARELLEYSLPAHPETAIRSGLALLRGMGYARYRVQESAFPWSIDFITQQAHSFSREFIRGYVHTLFELVYKKEIQVEFQESTPDELQDKGFAAVISLKKEKTDE